MRMMAKSNQNKDDETEQKTSIHTHSHEGERQIFMGIFQLVMVVLFIAASFAVSGMLKANKKELGKREKEDRVLFAETQTISPAPYRIRFQTTGVVEARSEISIVPQVGGKVIAVNDKFFEGGSFEADEVLFEIEPLDFELELQRLESAVAQARTAFNLEEAESEAAIAEWKQINGDTPVPYLVARKPQKAEAWANLKSAKAQLENAKLDLQRAKFSLPFAGRVLSANLENGQVVTAGQNYGSVYNAKNLEVQTSLKEQQLDLLMQSDNPDITIGYEVSGELKTVKGVLQRNASSLDSTTRFASVSIGFEKIPEGILPGVFVELDIQGPNIPNALTIPATAMQKGQKIWKLDAENTISAVEEEIVYSDDENIIFQGTNGAETIVTSKIPGAIAGMVIKTDAGDASDE